MKLRLQQFEAHSGRGEHPARQDRWARLQELLKCLKNSFTTSNLRENGLDRCGPDERLWVFVRFSQVGVDGGDQIVHAMEHAAPNPLCREFAKPSFDERQPGCARRREVQDKARMRGQPRGHIRVRVGPIVIQDQMERQDQEWL